MFINRLKIRGKILVFILGINILVLLTIFSIFYRFSKNILVHELQQKASEKVIGVSRTIEGYFLEKGKIAWTFSRNPYLKRWLKTGAVRGADYSRDPVYQDIIAHFRTIVAGDPEIYSAAVASEKSQEYFDNEEQVLPDTYYVGQRPWYIAAIAKESPSWDIDVSYTDQKAYLNYRHPIYDDEGRVLGAGCIDISLENLSSFMENLDIFSTGVPILIGQDGTILYHPDTSYVFKKKIFDIQDDGKQYRNLDQVFRRIHEKETGADNVIFEGKRRIFLTAPLPQLGWTVLLSVSAREMTLPLSRLTLITLVVIAVAMALLTVSVLFISGIITRPLARVVNMLRNIAEGDGDLVSRIHVDTKDETGDVAHWFNVFVEKMYEIVSQVRKNAGQLAVGTGEVSAAAVQLAAASEEQSTQAGEVAASVQEVAAAIVLNSQNANQTAGLAQKANEKALQGEEVMQASLSQMEEIVGRVGQAESIVNSLFRRMDKIREVVWTINDITAQTKVLALNASIEAANAGEQGKGFAVVAEEVRSLAGRTSEATKEISQTMKSIHEDAEKAFESMTSVKTAVSEGRQNTEQSGAAFEEIVQAVSEAMSMIQQIASVSEEQSTGAEEIARAVSAISDITGQSAEGVEQMAAAAQHLKEQTEELNQLVRQFTLDESCS
ncbi:MAG TPA: methyl-accepting chemotaxis protein [bacterium]|nr:methyl-accepting chemotaxis protein [bacterium]